MKNKLIMVLTCFLFLVGCGNTRRITTNTDVVVGGVMTAKVDTFKQAQLDSMCRADKISNNLDEDWICSATRDYSTKTGTVKYVYIKSISANNELIYTVYPYKNTLYIVNKRTTK